MVQSPFRPAMPVGEVAQHQRAARGVGHLGVELDAVEAAASSAMAAKGEPSEVAMTSKPCGMAVILSPWLIQTVSRWPTSPRPANSGLSLVDDDLGAAELAVVAALDRAAQLRRTWSSRRSRCPAPARRARTPPAARAGLSASCTLAGPPDRMIALGAKAVEHRPRPCRTDGSRNRRRLSRRRRAISWVTWLPKSTIRTRSWAWRLRSWGSVSGLSQARRRRSRRCRRCGA